MSPIPATAGIGLRFQHHRAVVETKPRVAWLEIHTENYMGGGIPLHFLEQARRDYPISMHGVGLSLGSGEGLDDAHLARTRALADRIEPGLISDHLSWSVNDGTYLADLLPLPLTEEALDVVCANVTRFQEAMSRQVLVENPSSYLRYGHSTIPEWEFMAAVANRTGCGILCDVNNIFVSASNHGWDALTYLDALPAKAIGEIHLAGHSKRVLDNGAVIRIDDHGSDVIDEVWAIYAAAIERFGAVPSLIERDNNIPALESLVGEADHAAAILSRLGPAQHDAHAA
ncbi:MAG TPA: DUF692 domain-containing protein [Magnetospirillaceae bacterium]|jgi:hypothetical protein